MAVDGVVEGFRVVEIGTAVDTEMDGATVVMAVDCLRVGCGVVSVGATVATAMDGATVVMIVDGVRVGSGVVGVGDTVEIEMVGTASAVGVAVGIAKTVGLIVPFGVVVGADAGFASASLCDNVEGCAVSIASLLSDVAAAVAAVWYLFFQHFQSCGSHGLSPLIASGPFSGAPIGWNDGAAVGVRVGGLVDGAAVGVLVGGSVGSVVVGSLVVADWFLVISKASYFFFQHL